MVRFGRFTLAAAAALTLAGCKDVGLQGNVPLADAVDRAPKPLVQQTTPLHPAPAAGAPQAFRLDSATWVASDTELKVGDGDVHEVATVDGTAVYALRWDDSPYDRLLAKRPQGGYQQYDKVIGR